MKISEPHLRAAAICMKRLSDVVTQRPVWNELAAAAFRSYVRAYSVHPASVRSYFHVKALHLGHVAHAFALKGKPTMVGASAAKEAAKQRKAKRGTEAQRKTKMKAREVAIREGMDISRRVGKDGKRGKP